MSECSSVLDMRETEEGDVSPLIMEHGYDIAVKVDTPVKQLSRLETFVTYRVRAVCARWSTPDQVRRRYNHFKCLHQRLVSSHPLLPVPPLPPLHSARQQLDRYGAKFVAIRAMALDCMLARIAKHPILTHSEDFRLFLTTPDEDIDKVLKHESSPLSLWGLSALTGGQEKTAVRVKDPEFSSALDYLQSLQHKLTSLCSLTNKLHKYQNACAAEYQGLRTSLTMAGCVSGGVGTVGQDNGRHSAVLPLLAAYCGGVRDKIKERDVLHAAYVAGNNTNDAMHNRLEQASEALRSELSDWTVKTRSELKQLLIEQADSQIQIYQNSLKSWENTYTISTQTNPEEIFKTVSKNCVQNLSPSKCKVETDTEFDDDDSTNSNDKSSNSKDKESLNSEELINHSNTINNIDYDKQLNSDYSNTSRDNVQLNLDYSNTKTNEQLNSNAKFDDNHSNYNRTDGELLDRQFEEILEENCMKTEIEHEKSDICMKNELKLEKTLDPLTEFAEIDLSNSS